MKDIKIIFFDIDGTLIAMDQDTISEKTLEALKLSLIHISEPTRH